MHRSRDAVGAALLAFLALAAPITGSAAVLLPQSDAEVVETLPSAGRARSEERALRQRWAANPGDAAVAVALSRRYLDQARAQGDPRFAGRAMAMLQHWPQLDTAPAEVVLMAATLQQYLHDFDGAAAVLERLVQREPAQAQAWLTLATIRRVQGRYDASDAACRGLLATGSGFYGRACEAENLSLRGRIDVARQVFDSLLAPKELPAAARAWLMTTVAETEARTGRRREAEAAYRAVLALDPNEYVRLSFADFLLDNGRGAEVPALLKDEPRSDVVLLRLAMAGARQPTPAARADIAELRDRMAQAALRPEARTTHAREQALFALRVEGQPERALQFARLNVDLQREPIDLLVLAETARAAKNDEALQLARRIQKDMGLHDVRLDALL
jgi:predicted Zn-dependent protease